MAAGTCSDHALLLERLGHLAETLESNTVTSGKLLEKLERVSTENSRASVELEHIKQSVQELKAADGEQWSAINSLRAKVYIGVGLALAGSAFATVLAGWISK